MPDGDCEVSIQLDLEGPCPVISVTGVLGRPGGALLTAMLQYVRQQHGRRAAVDLRGVPRADRHGLASLIDSGAVIHRASPEVGRALVALTGVLPRRRAG
jgi:hypothetical protein